MPYHFLLFPVKKDKIKIVQCTTDPRYVKFYPADSAVLIPDTSYVLALFKKGSNFSNREMLYPSDGLLNNPPYPTRHAMFGSYVNGPYYNYDLLITTYPSGRIFKITDISITQRQEKDPAYSTCTNSVNYSVNGAAYANDVPDYFAGGTGIMYVKY